MGDIAAQSSGRVILLLQKALAESTLSAYIRHWEQFMHFMVVDSHVPVVLPVEPMYIALFIARLEEHGLQASTMCSMLCGISFAHKLHGVMDPTSLVLSLMHA